jgi:hypothetical protein
MQVLPDIYKLPARHCAGWIFSLTWGGAVYLRDLKILPPQNCKVMISSYLVSRPTLRGITSPRLRLHSGHIISLRSILALGDSILNYQTNYTD